MSTPGRPVRNAATAAATTVLDALVAGGVRDLVLCPGSRSAPFALAAHDRVRTGALRLHTRLDERTAAFLALGIAKTSRRPTAVLTTSGTAVAHLHPAALEAAHAGVDLVLLTADRPAGVRGTGANQTTDFAVGFGPAAVVSVDVPAGVPGGLDDCTVQVRAWRAHVHDALRAQRRTPGPVHLNVQLPEPLVPDAPDGWTEVHEQDTAPGPDPASSSPPPPVTVLPGGPRTVVVAGDDAGPPARHLAERSGWPLLAEPSSGSRTGEHALRSYRLLLEVPELADRIERVVVAGHPTLSRPVSRLLRRPDIEHVALLPRAHHPGWPGRRAVTDLAGLVSLTAPALAVEEPDGSGWFESWQAADRAASRAVDHFLGAASGLLPHHVAAAVGAALPPSGLLVVGASNPIRDLDLVHRPTGVGERRLVLANRGLAGIDGTVSTAIGASIARPHSSRNLALMGDLTFLHDHAGLLLGPYEQRPDLTIVVVNDRGGSIFAGLEQGAPAYADSFEQVFALPHEVHLEQLCAATRTPYALATSRGELEALLASPNGGIEVVEARVDRAGRRELDQQLRTTGIAAASEALRS
ncbi:2-succinyl-5-enolpyruvyl-6-hydroxy-3-cyclohexene-1-carboxylic-acid synthase [Nocardioidaceae bacterium]|nr:2-succinyl-5-enolpyruvyl-6-hydroxy-3-cyclohexene-1-carboxylic-acid synthase [Nocardioidaceae bacterium]